ncbi:T9SS type A sorting domain-containing protein [Flavobacterium sp. F372]|uniref:SMP-30/gluconolactonase/LRE family protein n=1 Tax=Flavobacterium bernardetii TaxID=2813823 RepID=A0ABR7J2D5_9FLAO|nr:SMP-30/gluconolactonase/LRE family protein [Flavobacterium bernardetii]MBC5836088.1 SMP-30/gluconolactonase/LRE family protein [Flavobacterium bernardetii]NHF71273.1 T9SS type A sorting domain-containing protein [Flavobacterium bernardetii]
MSKILFFITTLFINTLVFSQQVTTVAGTTYGYLDGPGLLAQFNDPRGICIDSQGNIFIADADNNRIRKIEPSGNNTVTTFAGSGVEGYADGIGTNAVFKSPNGMCIDSQGNIYITDALNFKIRKITPAGMVTTVAGTTQGFADGAANTAKFSYLEGICIDAQGNLFVADGGNNRIRKITPAGIVSTVAGSTSGYQDGTGTTAKFDYPSGICIDANNNFFICELFNQKIRKINSLGIVSTIAGSTPGYADGQGTAAKFSMATGICVDGSGNLFVADQANNRIRKITPSGLVSTYSGSVQGSLDGDLSTALFLMPTHLIFDASSNLYITEIGNDKIRKISNGLSTNDFDLFNYSLYPNPNKGNFSINSLQSGSLEIYDILGQLVFTKKEVNTTNQIETNLKKGIYLVKITNEDGKTVTQKMVIE